MEALEIRELMIVSCALGHSFICPGIKARKCLSFAIKFPNTYLIYWGFQWCSDGRNLVWCFKHSKLGLLSFCEPISLQIYGLLTPDPIFHCGISFPQGPWFIYVSFGFFQHVNQCVACKEIRKERLTLFVKRET